MQELEQAVKDNSLSFLEYNDKAHYSNTYQIRRSQNPKHISKQTKWAMNYQYKIYLKENDIWIDMGKIHPHDLISVIQNNGVIYNITKAEIRGLDQ